MAEPTTTLQQLRRMIALELKMPFARRYKAGYLDADSGSTTTLVDTALSQVDKFWNRSWVYRVPSQEAALIVNFDARVDTVYLETPVTTFASGDDYEIHTLWNAYDIHEAINQAIRDSRRVYFDLVTDETLIVQENVLAYPLSSLSRVPWLISKVWLEQPSSVRRGQVQSATATTLVVENSGVLSNVDSNWTVSIYAGTGKGQIRSVASVAGATINVLAWATNPDSTSKYALWNPSEQLYDWYPWHAIRLDSEKEFPDNLYFSVRPTMFYGMRIRLEYAAYPLELSTEADTTVVPSSYILHAACSVLHGQKIGDTQADRDLHFGEAKRHKELAEEYTVRNAPHRPDFSVWSQHSNYYQPNSENPLNW